MPFKRWRKLNDDYQKLQKKLAVSNDIKEGISEIKYARKSGDLMNVLNKLSYVRVVKKNSASALGAQ
ncbi:MAG: hypothetical protein ABIQ74_10425 [Chitinophagales bacterium]